MGDPEHFSVVGGANPHTRTRFGRRKTVDRALAIRQWKHLHDQLRALGLHVEVIPPDPRSPGLVYPANAGVRLGDDFILSTLIPTRAAERPHYRRTIEALGIPCHTIQSRFEGEADLFPAGDHYLFTYGGIERQRFVPRLGFPPWRRVFGFRSQPSALAEIAAIQPLGRPVEKVRLIDERYYHGDTCLCSFGPQRNFLLAYLPVLDPSCAARLELLYRDRLLSIGEADAAIYAANAFHLELAGECLLLLPTGISKRLSDSLRAHDIRVLTVDVSEFLKKGGGSVKCMIGDLGALPQDRADEAFAAAR